MIKIFAPCKKNKKMKKKTEKKKNIKNKNVFESYVREFVNEINEE